ncbi:MAG: oligosaccharide flippase family protein [Methylobacillus sp.]|nr:oligosaccharide flippase family protein [Methylobacillus sp.]
MKLSRNLLVGLTSSIWTVLLGLAVVPLYLKYLGVEAYGLIGFFITMQAMLQLLDMGMASTINREIARYTASGNLPEAAKLLHSFAVIYWGVAVAIAGVIFALAPMIANHWLQPKQLSVEAVSHTVMLMGLVVACRWPAGLYQGALIGAHRLAVPSVINMAMTTIGSLGAVAILAFISPTIEVFFFWQVGIGLTQAIIMRMAAWRVIGRIDGVSFDKHTIRPVLKFSLGVGTISLAGLVLTQLDKTILSKTLLLADFGKYMLANMVAGGLYILISPVFNVVYPKFSALVAQQKFDELLLQYRTASQGMAVLLFPLAMAVILAGQPLLRLWMGNASLAAEIAPVMALLLAAYALHGMMHIPYALMLAHGVVWPMFKVYVALIVIMVPLTAGLSILHGVMGGGGAQLVLFMLYLLIGIWYTHKSCLKGYALTWLSKDLGVPMGVTIICGIAGYLVIMEFRAHEQGIMAELLTGGFAWGMASALSVYLTPCIRELVKGRWKLHLI